MRRALLLLAVGCASIGLTDPVAATSGSATAFACPSPDVLSQALGTPLTLDPIGSEPCRFALDVNGHAFIIVLSYATDPDLIGCFMGPYQPGPLGLQDLCGTPYAQVVQAWNPWGPGWLYLSLQSDAYGSIDDHLAVGTAVLQALGVVPGAAGTPQAPTTGPPASTAAPGAPPSTIAARDGYRTVVDDSGVVSVAIPVEWIAETAPHVTPEGLYVPRIAAGREAAQPVPGCDGCGRHIPLPMFSITVSPYEPVSPEAPPGCDALEVIPFDSGGFTGRREIGGGCDVSGEWILASRPGAFTVRIGLIYADSATGPLTEEDRAAAAAVFETVLATFAWTGRAYDEAVTAVGLPSTTTAPAPTVPAPAPPPTLPTLCVLADIDFAAVRSAPGTGNPEVGRIPPGTCGVVAVASDHSTGEEWLHVQYGGIDGWSAGRLYVPDANAPSPTTSPIGGGAPGSTGLWTFDGDWLDAVPQLGNEPVRGTGCGADGSIGDVIPDGWWFGLVRSSDGARFGFTLGCAYYGESARPHLEQCDPETCTWTESIMPVFPTDRVWHVPTRPDIVKELTAACAANAADFEAQSLRDGLNMYSWIHLTEGQADYVRYACPMG